MKTHKVMVLNGEARSGLAFVQSLGKRGFYIIVGGSLRLSRSFFSRYCDESFVYDFSKDEQTFHESILKNVKKFKPDILIPTGPRTSSVLIKYKKEYEKYTQVALSVDYGKFQLVNNKASMIKLAKKFGVQVPETYFPEDLSDIQKIKNNLPYPIILKPRVSHGSVGVDLAKNPDELINSYKNFMARKVKFPMFKSDKVIIQKFRTSNTTSAYILMKNNKVYAFMIKKNLVHYRNEFGLPVRTKTIKDEHLKKIVINFMKDIGWEGLACLNFVMDPEDNQLKLIDFNPRVWGQMNASVALGIDFPYLWYKLSIGEEFEPVIDYKENQIFSHIIFGEIIHIIRTKNKLQSLLDFLSLKKIKTNVDLSDLKPSLIQFKDIATKRIIL